MRVTGRVGRCLGRDWEPSTSQKGLLGGELGGTEANALEPEGSCDFWGRGHCCVEPRVGAHLGAWLQCVCLSCLCF